MPAIKNQAVPDRVVKKVSSASIDVALTPAAPKKAKPAAAKPGKAKPGA